MTPRDHRSVIALETLEVIRTGSYTHRGESHNVATQICECVDETITVENATFPENPKKAGEIRVANQTTTAAIQQNLGEGHVAALNFASATTPGGGFETGAQAQEECLARGSALYASQISQKSSFYEKNIEENRPFYSHRMIWSPQVPFFRDEYDNLIDPFAASIITAAAPNQGRIPAEQKSQTPAIFKKRISLMLALAASQNVDHLILGAWGCGVFGNNPSDVAKWFHTELMPHRNHFQSITFAIYCPNGPDANLLAFQTAFPS